MPAFRTNNANHILAVSKAVGVVLGGCYNDNRWKKDSSGLSTSATHVTEQVNSGSYSPAKGLVLADCDLTPGDAKYLSSNLPSKSYNFSIVDFSNNPKLGPLGLDYLIKGHAGIEHSKLSTTPLTQEQRAAMPVPMFMGKPFVLPQSFIDKAKEFEKTYVNDDHVYKGILSRGEISISKLDLSNCGIGDAGVDLLKDAIAKGKLKLKNIDLSNNSISKAKLTEFLGVVSQDMFVLTEKNEDTGEGKALFKGSDGKLYDFNIKPEGKDCSVEFGDGVTGISGVSSGDTCPPSVKEQMKACFVGGISTTVGNWEKCSGVGNFKAKLVCSGSAFLTGCAIGTATIATANCVNAEHYRDHDHDSNFGFSATGGTEIQGSYIDNSRGPMGSSFDLSQHDF